MSHDWGNGSRKVQPPNLPWLVRPEPEKGER